ncbi:MAG: hypothetical protein QM680_08610 [Luteolibacter sp.]
MSHTALFKEDAELQELLKEQALLEAQAREIADRPRRIEMEKRERESTIPPLTDIDERARQKKYEEIVTRREVVNVRRDQGRSVMLLCMLLMATASLIWWGLRLMEG